MDYDGEKSAQKGEEENAAEVFEEVVLFHGENRGIEYRGEQDDHEDGLEDRLYRASNCLDFEEMQADSSDDAQSESDQRGLNEGKLGVFLLDFLNFRTEEPVEKQESQGHYDGNGYVGFVFVLVLNFLALNPRQHNSSQN